MRAKKKNWRVGKSIEYRALIVIICSGWCRWKDYQMKQNTFFCSCSSAVPPLCRFQWLNYNSVEIITNLIIISVARDFHWLMKKSRVFFRYRKFKINGDTNSIMTACLHPQWMEAVVLRSIFFLFYWAHIKLISTVEI